MNASTVTVLLQRIVPILRGMSVPAAQTLAMQSREGEQSHEINKSLEISPDV